MTDPIKPTYLEAAEAALPLAPLELNPEDYKEAMGVSTLSDEDIAMLQSLWDIMSILVNLNIPVDTIDQALPALSLECDSGNLDHE